MAKDNKVEKYPGVSKEEKARLKAIKRAKKAGIHNPVIPPIKTEKNEIRANTAFVLGNGTSRMFVEPQILKPKGTVYACNAIYRTFTPDYLIAVDTRMVIEITRTGYQLENELWTNPNRSYRNIPNLNLFEPSKGWSSGPTALWLASQHSYSEIFILGFDYKGKTEGRYFNNVFADTVNYKKSTDRATFYGNWLKQTTITVKEHPHIKYYRVLEKDGFIPKELSNLDNIEHITPEKFKEVHNL